MHSRFFPFVIFFLAPVALASDTAAIRSAVETYLQIQTRDLPGSVSLAVGPINTRGSADCLSPQVSLPAGARAWGRTTVVIRCATPGATRSLYVPVQVQVTGKYLVAARPLALGQELGPTDVALQSGDLTALPPGFLTDPGQATGRIAAQGLPAGQPLAINLLKAASVVQQGQKVSLRAQGPGFQVATEGEALNNAAVGQVVRVRGVSGQTLSGIATAPATVTLSH